MAKQARNDPLIRYAARPERGVSIPVVPRRVILPDGKTATAGAIDLASAEVPERSYLAQACGAKYERYTVTIMLAQPKLDGGFRNLVLIAMTPSSVAQFLLSVDEMSNPSLKEIAEQIKIEPEPISQFPTTEPEQTATLPANMIAVAISGHDTCMDFYNANAFSQIKVRTSNQINLEPMVRVTLTTALFMALITVLRQLAESFPPDAAAWKEAKT